MIVDNQNRQPQQNQTLKSGQALGNGQLNAALTQNDSTKRKRSHQTWGIYFVWQALYKQQGFMAILLLSALSALLSGPFILSAYLGFAINNIVYTKDLDLFFNVTLVVFVSVLLGLLAEFYTNKIGAQANSRICYSIVSRGWSQLIKSPNNMFCRFRKSELTSVLTDTMETLQKHQLFIIQNTIRSLFVVIFTVVILTSHHPVFLFLVSFFVFITCAVPIYVARKAEPHIQQEPDRLAAINGFVSSSLGLQLFLKSRDLSGLFNRFKRLLFELSATQAGKWLIWNFSFNLKVTLNLLSHVCILWFGGWLFFNGLIGLTELVVVYVLVSMVIPRLDNIYKIYNYSQSLSVCYAKLNELTEVNETAESDETSVKAAPIQDKSYTEIYSLKLNQVSFTYPQASTPIINDLNLVFEKGKSCLITGKSGAGKSTLINLVCAMQQPDSGYLEINNNPISYNQVEPFWHRIALHDQSNLVLRQRTVLDNISLFGRKINEGRFNRACHLLNFTHCLNKPISALSGGELQRLCFIRCYAHNADVFIFDEPTASLDQATEQQIITLLGELNNEIVIVVTHNQELARHFDLVVNLDGQTITKASYKDVLK